MVWFFPASSVRTHLARDDRRAVTSMFHSNTHKLIDYWRSKAPGGRAPARHAIDPSEFATLAPQVFMAGRVCSGIYPLRLVGGFLTAFHQRDLRQQNALSLFQQRDRMNLQTALEMARRKPEPIVASVNVTTETGEIGMEILFAPVSGTDGGPDRFLGLYQPLSLVARLGGEPPMEFTVRELRNGGAAEAPRLRLAALDGRRIA